MEKKPTHWRFSGSNKKFFRTGVSKGRFQPISYQKDKRRENEKAMANYADRLNEKRVLNYAERIKANIDNLFRQGMTAEEFFNEFGFVAPFWSMFRNDWEATLCYEWQKPVRDYRISYHSAEEGRKIGIGNSPYYCLDILI